MSCLRSAGVRDVGVVVGWRKEAVVERLLPLGVTVIHNTHPDIRESGTTHSIQFAARSPFAPLDGKDTALILDGDIVYEQALIDAVVGAPGSTKLAVTPVVGDDPEEVRIYGDGSAPRLIGKGLCPPLTDGLRLIGEATGIWRVAAQDHALLRALLGWLVGTPGGGDGFGFAGVASEHEELAQYMITLGRLSAIRLDSELLFMEADFVSDVERIREEVYPEILRRERKTSS